MVFTEGMTETRNANINAYIDAGTYGWDTVSIADKFGLAEFADALLRDREEFFLAAEKQNDQWRAICDAICDGLDAVTVNGTWTWTDEGFVLNAA